MQAVTWLETREQEAEDAFCSWHQELATCQAQGLDGIGFGWLRGVKFPSETMSWSVPLHVKTSDMNRILRYYWVLDVVV